MGERIHHVQSGESRGVGDEVDIQPVAGERFNDRVAAAPERHSVRLVREQVHVG